jgi:hypothetical protein
MRLKNFVKLTDGVEDLIVELNGLSYMEESELRFMLDCAWNLRGEEGSFVPVKDLKTAVVNGKLLYDREVIGVTIMDSIGCSDEYVGSYLVVVVK